MAKIDEYWTLPDYCPVDGGEWLEYFADDDYVYHKCLACDKRVKIPLKK